MSLKLKCLEIAFCSGIKLIEIYDTNLVSFSCLGEKINLFINNVPMLDEISIGEGYSVLEKDVFSQLSGCLYKLEILTLDIYRPEEHIKIFAFPELPNLEELILKLGAWNDDCLLEFTSLLLWMSPSKKGRKIRPAAKCPHQYLKLVEISDTMAVLVMMSLPCTSLRMLLLSRKLLSIPDAKFWRDPQ